MPVRLRTGLRRIHIRTASVEALAQHILDLAGRPRTELSLSLVGDRRMQQLNRHYRGRDRTTDVLAFAFGEAEQPGPALLGDVIISVETAIRQAADADEPLDRELVRLLVHGVLHLVGYDHERSEREARRMRLKESRIIHALLPLPRLVQGGGQARRNRR